MAAANIYESRAAIIAFKLITPFKLIVLLSRTDSTQQGSGKNRRNLRKTAANHEYFYCFLSAFAELIENS